MERDYDYASAATAADLEDAGRRSARSAGERAVKRLDARKVGDRQGAGGLRSAGRARPGRPSAGRDLRRRDRARHQLPEGQAGPADLRPAITIIDDPHRLRGLRSKPFDGEGVANRQRALIEDGVLTTWLLDCARRASSG